MMMVTVLMAALALTATQGEVEVTVREPVAPTTVSTTFTARCGSRTLELRNIGVARPRPGSPQLLLNGKPSQAAAALLGFIDRDDAVYRVFPECPREGGFLVRVYRATAGSAGSLHYEATAVRIDPNGKVRVSDPEAADATAFWLL
jgi:hypothetical protein